jgi:hypothetical protein
VEQQETDAVARVTNPRERCAVTCASSFARALNAFCRKLQQSPLNFSLRRQPKIYLQITAYGDEIANVYGQK